MADMVEEIPAKVVAKNVEEGDGHEPMLTFPGCEDIRNERNRVPAQTTRGKGEGHDEGLARKSRFGSQQMGRKDSVVPEGSQSCSKCEGLDLLNKWVGRIGYRKRSNPPYLEQP